MQEIKNNVSNIKLANSRDIVEDFDDDDDLGALESKVKEENRRLQDEYDSDEDERIQPS